MLLPPLPVANYAQLLAARAIAAEVKAYAPVAVDTGRVTWFEGTGAFPCTEPAEWLQLWKLHVNDESVGSLRIGTMAPAAPTVDFTKNFVLAVFGGQQRGVAGYRAASGYVLGRNAVLRLVPVLDTPSPSSVVTPSPWAFFVLPRTRAALRVELLVGERWTPIVAIKPTR